MRAEANPRLSTVAAVSGRRWSEEELERIRRSVAMLVPGHRRSRRWSPGSSTGRGLDRLGTATRATSSRTPVPADGLTVVADQLDEGWAHVPAAQQPNGHCLAGPLGLRYRLGVTGYAPAAGMGEGRSA